MITLYDCATAPSPRRDYVADITAVVVVDFARVVKLRPGEQQPQLQRGRQAMAQRPSMAP